MLNRSVTYLLFLFILCITGYGYALPTGQQPVNAALSASSAVQHPGKKKIHTDFLVYNETTDDREEDDASESDITTSTTAAVCIVGYSCLQCEPYAQTGFPATVQSLPYFSVSRYLYHRVFRI